MFKGRASHVESRRRSLSQNSISSYSSDDPLLGDSPRTGLAEEADEGEAEARRINRRIDVALVPLLSLLYLLNGLDRSNIGNAQTQGFTDDIGVLPDDLNHAVSLFFVAFVLFQVPSSIVGRWIGPNNWIPIIMFLWGLVTFAHAFIRGRDQLIAMRVLIGVLEAGFYPTAVAYLASFYRPYDLATRLASFFGMYAIAGAFSGLLAYGIFQIDHPELKTWQLLFILEGTVTCILALAAWAWLPTGPDTAWFLSKQERSFLVDRVRRDSPESVEVRDRKECSLWQDITETVRDWKPWFMLMCNICASVPTTAFSVFLPLVVEGMGYSAIEANLMSVPPAICGAMGLYLFAWSSDRQAERGYHIMAAIVLALSGLVVVICSGSNDIKYVGLCVFLFGSYAPPSLTVAWLSDNTPRPGQRAVVLGVNGLGNLAGVIGSQVFRAEYAPGYRTPFLTTLAFAAAALVGYLSYRLTLQAVNKNETHRAAALMEAAAKASTTTNQRLSELGMETTNERQAERTGGAGRADHQWADYGL
ncbi:major facilitator superfamily transporter [Podospora didyma]|uniref:Major facilitator superfamily transporter n=1 Tax=Podospora didyma TaxID=330526 RepID=A0AAE0TVM4_9PEZI|nr:major facilitator superfamily transporter [Podospora didyma]